MPNKQRNEPSPNNRIKTPMTRPPGPRGLNPNSLAPTPGNRTSGSPNSRQQVSRKTPSQQSRRSK